MGQPQPQANTAQMAGAPTDAPVVNGHDADDIEWEYEYDSNETEDVYFTVDITTHVPNALANSKREKEDNEESKAQFIDLHTANPLIKFNDGVYDCYWSTDVGSQFYIAQSGVVANPRRTGNILDVVGVSRARLIGKPVRLEARSVYSAPSTTAQRPAATNNEQTNTRTTEQDLESGQALIIDREDCKNIAAERQASFLEKLSAIKLQKGENDPVPMYSIKYYHEPENKAEIKQRSLAADAEAKRQAARETIAPDRPRKRRKRLTAVEKGLVPNGLPGHLRILCSKLASIKSN